MAKLIILGAGIMQAPIIRRAKELGHYIITIDRDKNAYGNIFSDCPLEIDTNDYTSIIEVAIKEKIDGILTSSDLPVRVVASVCEKLKLPGLSKNSAFLCTNKYLMREHLCDNGFLVPKFRHIKNVTDVDAVNFFPAILKPLDSSGSRGVTRVNSMDDLINLLPYSLSFSRCGEALVEEFIDGPEYSVETLSQGGRTNIIAITEKTIKGQDDNYFVEDRHIIPANITEATNESISKTVTKFIETLKLGDSPTHTELKVNSKGIYIIESGARLGGDFIASDLVPLATGIDMLGNAIRIALGEPIDITCKKNKHSGIQFINAENYYVIESYIKNNTHNIEHFQIEPFAEKSLENSFSRLGYFIVSADIREKLISILDCTI
jgi:carbamoyl-phosphate synthase large subunit